MSADNSHEISRLITLKLHKRASAAVVIGALRLILCMLGNFACFCFCLQLLIFKKKSFRNTISVKQSRPRSGPTLGLILVQTVCKIISRQQKLPLVGKELRQI